MTREQHVTVHGPGVFVPAELVPLVADAVRLRCRDLGRNGPLPQVVADLQVCLSEAAAPVRKAQRARRQRPTSDAASDGGAVAEVAAGSVCDLLSSQQLADRLRLGVRHAQDVARAAGVQPAAGPGRALRWPAAQVAVLAAARAA